MFGNVCFAVAHYDDEVLGFGGTIQRFIEEFSASEVFVLWVNSEPHVIHDLDRLRAQKADRYKSMKVLGILEDNYETIEATRVDRFWVQEIEKYLIKKDISTVFTHHPSDCHQEHKRVHDLLKGACRSAGPTKVTNFLTGEVLSSTHTSPDISNPFVPNIFFKLNEKQIKTKVNALQCYSREIRMFPHPRSEEGVLTLAKYNGMKAGTEYAEGFNLSRYVV